MDSSPAESCEVNGRPNQTEASPCKTEDSAEKCSESSAAGGPNSPPEKTYKTMQIPIQTEQGLKLSALNPKYLHTNSTSHTWPFSAIAELIDNAYDPDVNARQLWIDVENINGLLALTFTDNGNGMEPNKLYKMLSFGFSEKISKRDHLAVGQYGNGFKSGSMRLGKDALVFTKTRDAWCLGFLSQTYLTEIEAETIVVPIVEWEARKFVLNDIDGGVAVALTAILDHSLIKTHEEIKEQFRYIPGAKGTRIIIFNLRETNDSITEFDFASDKHDIKIPDDAQSEILPKREQQTESSYNSLRSYCAILYLKPKMQIILRKKVVKTIVISKSLRETEHDTYRPFNFTEHTQRQAVKVTFGFSRNKENFGIMMYHKNRLIKPYVRVAIQSRGNPIGVGVVGVIECNFLTPTHNKQDFDYTKAYRACMAALNTKLKDYWREKKGIGEDPSEFEAAKALPDTVWVQCENPDCLKWRILPDGTDPDSLSDVNWMCSDNPDTRYNTCGATQQLGFEQEDVIRPYEKKFKKKLVKEKEKVKELKKLEERRKLFEEFERDREERDKEERLERLDRVSQSDEDVSRPQPQHQQSTLSTTSEISNEAPDIYSSRLSSAESTSSETLQQGTMSNDESTSSLGSPDGSYSHSESFGTPPGTWSSTSKLKRIAEENEGEKTNPPKMRRPSLDHPIYRNNEEKMPHQLLLNGLNIKQEAGLPMFPRHEPRPPYYAMQDPGTQMFSRFDPGVPYFAKQEPGTPPFSMQGPSTPGFPIQGPHLPSYSRQGPMTPRFPNYSVPEPKRTMNVKIKKETSPLKTQTNHINGMAIPRRDAASQTDSPFSSDSINYSVKLKTVDTDIIEDLQSRPQESLIDLLAHRSQLLRNLRTNVCKMLQILIPDQTVPDANGMAINDNTIDKLIEAVCKENDDDEDNDSTSSLEIVEIVSK